MFGFLNSSRKKKNEKVLSTVLHIVFLIESLLESGIELNKAVKGIGIIVTKGGELFPFYNSSSNPNAVDLDCLVLFGPRELKRIGDCGGIPSRILTTLVPDTEILPLLVIAHQADGSSDEFWKACAGYAVFLMAELEMRRLI